MGASLTVRSFAGTQLERPVFYDMKHSNNGARIRLWIKYKKGASDVIDTKVLGYADLKQPDFLSVNPLGKIPGLVRTDGVTVFESYVILDYLEDKYSALAPSFKPATPEGRQHMELIIRCHDLYISSPNSTQPGFSHSQGGMYLSTGFHGPVRGMDLTTRAAKIKEIWEQLTWLNAQIKGPYMCGSELTLADFTWYPTTIFMEYMLPRVLGWPDVFRDEAGPFPEIAKWWNKVSSETAFAGVRQEIFEYWEEMEKAGQFQHIRDEIAADTSGLKFKYP